MSDTSTTENGPERPPADRIRDAGKSLIDAAHAAAQGRQNHQWAMDHPFEFQGDAVWQVAQERRRLDEAAGRALDKYINVVLENAPRS